MRPSTLKTLLIISACIICYAIGWTLGRGSVPAPAVAPINYTNLPIAFTVVRSITPTQAPPVILDYRLEDADNPIRAIPIPTANEDAVTNYSIWFNRQAIRHKR